jgi:hypothetical protein
MSIKDYAERKNKPKKRPVAPILVAILLVVLIVGVFEFYHSDGVPSNTVYCGVFQYIEFPAQTVIGQSTKNVTETITTAVSYTTSTSILGKVGNAYSNSTSTTNAIGDQFGVETICKYVSNTSSSSSSSSPSLSSSLSSSSSSSSTSH